MSSIDTFSPDLFSVTASMALVAGYYIHLAAKTRRNPTSSNFGINNLARKLWVEHVMGKSGTDIMAVQTMRNFIMGGALMASTAAMLIIGCLTLVGQAGNVENSWHALNVFSASSQELWAIKLLALLVDFIFAFFAFAMSVRLANHVVFMVNVRDCTDHYTLSTEAVGGRLNRAGNMYATGMRTLFFAIPLVLWLFGPYFLLAATLCLIVVLRQIDHSEQLDNQVDERETEGKGAEIIDMPTRYAAK